MPYTIAGSTLQVYDKTIDGTEAEAAKAIGTLLGTDELFVPEGDSTEDEEILDEDETSPASVEEVEEKLEEVNLNQPETELAPEVLTTTEAEGLQG